MSYQRCFLLLCSSLAPLLVAGQIGQRATVFHTNVEDCVINAVAGTFYLAQGLAQLTEAITEDCPYTYPMPTGHHQHGHHKSHGGHHGNRSDDLVDWAIKSSPVASTACIADGFGIVQAFLNVAGYIAGSFATCPKLADHDAECASNILSSAGGITEAVQAILSMLTDCDNKKVTCPLDYCKGFPGYVRRKNASQISHTAKEICCEVVASDDAEVVDRRLHGVQAIQAGAPASVINKLIGHAAASNDPYINHKPLNQAWCVINSGSTAVYLAQAAAAIQAATSDCAAGQNHGTSCEADVASIIAALTDVVGYIGAAMSTCPTTAIAGAACAGDVGSLGNGLFGLQAASSQLGVCTRLAETQGKSALYARPGSMLNIDLNVTSAKAVTVVGALALIPIIAFLSILRRQYQLRKADPVQFDGIIRAEATLSVADLAA